MLLPVAGVLYTTSECARVLRYVAIDVSLLFNIAVRCSFLWTLFYILWCVLLSPLTHFRGGLISSDIQLVYFDSGHSALLVDVCVYATESDRKSRKLHIYIVVLLRLFLVNSAGITACLRANFSLFFCHLIRTEIIVGDGRATARLATARGYNR